MANEVLDRDDNHQPVAGAITDNAAEEVRMLRIDDTTKGLKVTFVGGAGGGDVTGPASSTDNAIARFDGTGGKTLQNSGVTISDSNVILVPSLTASEIVITDASKNLVSAAVATYPSLAELSYVKGVTSAIQTQINAKGAGTVTSVTSADANATVATGTSTPVITIVNAPTVTVADAGGDTTTFPMLAIDATGNLSPRTDAGLTYNANTNALTTGNFIGTFAGNTFTTGTGTLTIAAAKTVTYNATTTFAGTDGKTLTISNSLTLAGTDSTVMTFPSTSATIARTDAGQTFNGLQTLAENASIGLDPAGSADGKYTGITVTATAGYTQAFGDLVYLDPTDSRWELCDANSAAGADGDSRGIIGMVVVTGTDGTACTILLSGIIRADAKFPTFTVNNPIYVSETAGSVTQTQPTTTDVVIRIVGAALTTDEMWFNPDNTWITHT